MDLWLHFVIQNGDRENHLQRQQSLSINVSLSPSLCRNVRFWISSWRCAVSRPVFVFTHDSLLRFTASIKGDLPVAHIELTTVMSTRAMKWWYSNPPSQLSVFTKLCRPVENMQKNTEILCLLVITTIHLQLKEYFRPSTKSWFSWAKQISVYNTVCVYVCKCAFFPKTHTFICIICMCRSTSVAQSIMPVFN